MANNKTLSPAEWQSVSNSLVELTELMAQARKMAASASATGILNSMDHRISAQTTDKSRVD